MILTNLEDVVRYRNISDAIDKAIDYIKSGEWKNLPQDKKRYVVCENKVEAMRMSYEPKEDNAWENHNEWIDIQIIVSGEEKMLFAPIYNLKKDGEYLSEKDFQKWNGNLDQTFIAREGDLLFFFPEDGHKPGLKTENSSIVDKVVVKVKV